MPPPLPLLVTAGACARIGQQYEPPKILSYLGNSSMRRVRSDVSHRIRRQPSIFSAAWFRVCLGAGVVLVLALLVGPWLAGWVGSDLPRSLFLLAPWGGDVKATQTRPATPARPSEPVADKPAPPKASAPSPAPIAPRGTAAATGKPPASPVDAQPG
jgi:hypothetical protein